MKVTSNKVETNVIELQVEVEASRVGAALQSAYKKVVQQISLPGFRKGKAPRRLVESRFGVEIFYEDAMEILFNESYPQAVMEAGISPVDQPEVTDINIEKDQPFTFTAKVTVMPEVVLGDYKGVSAEKVIVSISDETVDAEIAKMREEHARLETVEEAAVNGDTVVIDYEGFVDGEAFAGGAAENHLLELGSNSFIPGYEEQLVGASAGDDVDVTVTFPEEYHSDELAGQEALFKVKVHEVKRKFVPELDEDFVLEISEFETVDEFMADVRSKLQLNAEQQSEAQFRNDVLGKVVEASTVEIPEVMVSQEIDAMTEESSRNLKSYGIEFEQYLQMIGKSLEDHYKDMYPQAEMRVKTDLVLDEIVKAEAIELDAEEFEKRIDDMAAAYNQKPEDMRKMLAMQPQAMEQLAGGWKKDQAISLIADNAVVTEVAPKADEEETAEA